MLIAALIFVLAMAALGQFTLFYWRALLATTAAQPLSTAVREAAALDDREVVAGDFPALLTLCEVCPSLDRRIERLGAVRLYYRALDLAGRILPALASWTSAEQATCSRYVAVVLDQRMLANASYAGAFHRG